MTTQTTPAMWRTLRETDPEIAGAIADELRRQNHGLELIASENFVSRAILEAAGSVFTNKYAEGYPGRRYYGGCEYVDVVERAAISRAKALFGADHANVQPHSGAQANMAVYFTLLKPGDTVLGMNLAHGGHLTHGHPLNFSGKLYTIVPYGVKKDDDRIDYDELDRLGRLPSRQRRHRYSPHARRRLLEGHHGQGCGGGARQSGDHGQQERHSVRSESADGRARRPHRHARGHDARHARTGNGNRRRADRARAQEPRRRSGTRYGPRRGRGVVPE